MPPPLTPSPPELITHFEELAGLAPEADLPPKPPKKTQPPTKKGRPSDAQR